MLGEQGDADEGLVHRHKGLNIELTSLGRPSALAVLISYHMTTCLNALLFPVFLLPMLLFLVFLITLEKRK